MQTGKNRLQLKVLVVLQADKKTVCFLFDNKTVERKKKCVWELVNHSDFLHSNHTLNLFPLSDQVFLALYFFQFLSIFLCFDAKSKYCSKVVLPMQKNRVWLKSIYRYHSHNLTQPKRIDAFILWRLPQIYGTILTNDFNADTNFHNDDNWTNPFIYVPVKKEKIIEKD